MLRLADRKQCTQLPSDQVRGLGDGSHDDGDHSDGFRDDDGYDAGLHKLWYPNIRDTSTWSKFGAHGEHGDVFLFSNLGAL